MRLIALFLFLSSCSRQDYIDLNTEFPSFSESTPFQIADSKTKFLILNFFAPDCPPCIEELPDLKIFHAKKTAETNFIGIGSILDAAAEEMTATAPQLKDGVSQFIEEHQIKYPVYLAGSRELKKYKVTGFPETFVFELIDGKYRLRRRFLSVVKLKELEESLQRPGSPW